MKTLPKALCALLLAGLAVGAMLNQTGAASGYGSSSKPKLSLKVAEQTKSEVLQNGLEVGITCSKSCKVKLTAKKGSKTLGKGSKTLKKGNVKIKFNKKGKKALKNAKGSFSFKVKGKATSGGKTSKTINKTVTLS